MKRRLALGPLALAFVLVWGGAGRHAAAQAEDAPRVVPGAPNLAAPPPDEAGPPPPPVSVPAPAPPSEPAAPPPSPAPAARSPAAVPAPPPGPAPAGGDAEPAPLPPPPPGPRFPADGLAGSGPNRVSFGARFAYRLGDAGDAVPPAAGYGIVGSFDHTYGRVEGAVALAVGVDFSSDRFATGEQGTSLQNGVSVTYSSTRVLSENDFVLTHTFSVDVRRVRPFLTLGLGLGVGSFESVAPQYRPGSAKDTHALGRASLGADLAVAPDWGVCVRADYTAVRWAAPLTTEDGRTLPLFGDGLDIDVAAVYRF